MNTNTKEQIQIQTYENKVLGGIGNHMYAHWQNAFPNTDQIQIERNAKKFFFELRYKKNRYRHSKLISYSILGELECHTSVG